MCIAQVDGYLMKYFVYSGENRVLLFIVAVITNMVFRKGNRPADGPPGVSEKVCRL